MNEAYQNMMPMLYSTLASSQGWSPMMAALMSGAATSAIEGDLSKGFMSGLMSFGMGKAMSGAGKQGMGDDWEDASARERMRAIFSDSGVLMDNISQPGAFLPLVTGAGSMAQANARESWQDQVNSRMGNGDQARQQWARAVQYNPYGVPQYAQGGQVQQAQQLASKGRHGDDNLVHVSNEELQGLASMMPMTRNPQTGLPEAFAWAPIIAAGISALGGWMSSKENKKAAEAAAQRSGSAIDVNLPDPIETQSRLRGQNVAPPPGFMPGFNPEFRYFQNLQPGETPQAPPFVQPHETIGMYNPMINQAALGNQQQFFQNYLPPMDYWMQQEAEFGNPRLNERYAQGGPVDKYASGGLIEEIAELKNMYKGGEVKKYAAGGLTSMGPPQANEALQVLAQALSGAMPQEQADAVIQQFIQQFGQQAFDQVREAILGSGTQNEGMVSGPGGGMDDQVMGSIAGQQPVAVSPGEYIVPADVVSGLGDGSSDAGAQQLDQMSDRVRVAKTGGMVQPPKLDERVVPA